MNAMFDRLKLIFLVVFVVLSTAATVYHFGWVRPAQKCELEEHKWWDPEGRVCAKPVLISDITGRTIQDKDAEAAALKAIGRTPRPDPKAEVKPAAKP
jgi:hypothetical protein